MALGKMTSFIDIVSTEAVKDAEGFATTTDTIIASVRAYKEERHGSERWSNLASFSSATAMFRFRKIPNVVVDTTLYIVCNGQRYNIVSAEDVRGKGMYIEVMAELIEGSVT